MTFACLCVLAVVARGDGEPTGIVAAYSFDEGTGSSLGDSSGESNTGTISGASWTGSGRYGGALNFDGVDDKVTISDSDSLDLSNGMTVEAWVKPDTLGDYRTAVLKETASHLSYALYAGTSSSDRPGMEITSNSLTGGSALPTGSWSHLTGTYDGARLRLYVNGVLVSTKAETDPIVPSSNPLSIGGNGIWGEYFDGLIDEIRIYDRPLSQGEIRSDMAAGIGTRLGSDGSASFVAGYGFDEGTGSMAGDSSDGGNNGTVSGAAWTTGRFGGALDFDGVDDVVTVPDSDSLDLSNAMTLEAWVKPNAVGSWQTALMKEASSYLVYGLYASTSGSGFPLVEIDGDGQLAGVAALSNGSWAHVAATYDGTTARLYVNGSQVASKAADSVMPNSSSPLSIGGNGVWGENFDGLVDEVRVYDRALSAQEVGADMARSVAAQTGNNDLPEADFSASPNPVAVGDDATFDASASDDPDGSIAKYEWDLDGNGSFETDTATTDSAQESYEADGSVDVGLRVTDDHGDLATTTRELTILEPPVNDVLPALSGTPIDGETLSATTGTWSGAADSRRRLCDGGS